MHRRAGPSPHFFSTFFPLIFLPASLSLSLSLPFFSFLFSLYHIALARERVERRRRPVKGEREREKKESSRRCFGLNVPRKRIAIIGPGPWLVILLSWGRFVKCPSSEGRGSFWRCQERIFLSSSEINPKGSFGWPGKIGNWPPGYLFVSFSFLFSSYCPSKREREGCLNLTQARFFSRLSSFVVPWPNNKSLRVQNRRCSTTDPCSGTIRSA